MKDRTFKNGDGSQLGCKRARTNLQKQRNDELVSAEKVLKEKHGQADKVKINWQERRIEVDSEPVFVQSRDANSGKYLPPFSNLNK